MSDRFYDYSSFSDDRLKKIVFGWNGLGGYHGLLIKKIGELIPSKVSVLDVGCGLCHLYEAIKDKVGLYVGVDKDPRIIKWAKERWPNLKILQRNVYDLNGLDIFDVVTAIGLYSGEPEKPNGIEQMLNHTEIKLIITFFRKTETGTPPFLLKLTGKWKKYHKIPHNIDEKLVIMEIYK